MVEARHANTALPGNVVECGADFFVRASQGHAKITSRPPGAWDLEVEITIRKKYPAAAFRNEGVAVSQLAAERLYFIARTRGHQYQRNPAPIQLSQGFLGFGKGTCARVQQSAFKGREN